MNLDFYQSRGIYKVMTCRLSDCKKSRRQFSNVLASVCKELRDKRDVAFRDSVMAEAADKLQTSAKFTRCVVPKHRGLRILAALHSDIIDVRLPNMPGCSDETVLSFIACAIRDNHNSELYVEMTSASLAYVS